MGALLLLAVAFVVSYFLVKLCARWPRGRRWLVAGLLLLFIPGAIVVPELNAHVRATYSGTFPWLAGVARGGWRLPSVIELTSLIDPSVLTGASLPSGHPFVGIQLANYWSATSDSEVAWTAFFVGFTNGGVSGGPKSDALLRWCVRGGMSGKVY